MALTTHTQTRSSLAKRIRGKLRRIKRLTKGYIKNMAAYKAYRQWRHHITGPLRMARADILREDHHEQKGHQEEEQKQLAAKFIPLYVTHPEIRQHLEANRVLSDQQHAAFMQKAAFSPFKHLNFGQDTAGKMEAVEKTATDDLFLLDDVTVKKPVVKKAVPDEQNT